MASPGPCLTSCPSVLFQHISFLIRTSTSPITHLVPPYPQPGLVPQNQDSLPLLEETDFLRIAHLAHRCFGLDLRGDKQSLVASRLARLVRELGLSSFRQYCDYLYSDRTGAALTALADRLTTNHTAFFREPGHFDFLRSTILPTLRSRSHIHMWSAGCSSGEEPYSIAISVLEAAPRLAPRVRIRATDISTRMLERASTGLYSADRVAGLPPGLSERYFVPDAPNTFRLGRSVRDLIDFARQNLLDPLPVLRFSVIFCRNVMLYFDQPTHQMLIGRFAAHLEPGGYLFIGHSESLSGVEHSLESAGPAIYRKPVHGADLFLGGANTRGTAAAQADLPPFHSNPPVKVSA